MRGGETIEQTVTHKEVNHKETRKPQRPTHSLRATPTSSHSRSSPLATPALVCLGPPHRVLEKGGRFVTCDPPVRVFACEKKKDQHRKQRFAWERP